jgi:Ca2+-binding RTX toxin-like protein
MRRALLLAISLLGLLAACPPAMASVASVSNDRLTITGAPGEVNDLVITSGEHDEDSYVRVHESGPGATLSDGSGCVMYAGDAYCDSVDRITVNAGDGDDKVVNQTGARATLSGGRGADQLTGGTDDDTIDGQEDADTLTGGYGYDDIRGGSGVDTVSYSYASYRVVVDADGYADDGAVGGHDNVRPDVENLSGGRASDTLIGNAGPNVLDGGDGNDTLHGGDGGDALVGGAGRDSVSGDAGDDSLNTVDGGVDSVVCGEGGDTATADEVDEVAADCENTGLSTAIAPPPPAPALLRFQQKRVRVTAKGVAPLRLRCTRAARGACTGKVTLTAPTKAKSKAKAKSKRKARARRKVLGRARFRVRRGRLATVRVRLSRNGRRRVMRRRRVRCKVSVAVRRAGGRAGRVRGTVTLVAPKVKAR